jgi:NAD(P)-dependent dehydrogenase (short-subunit alcohol dehydrogenase family)
MTDFVQSVQDGSHASKGYPNTCYGMSKCGIIAWTRLLAREYHDLAIYSVDPGYCATDQNNNQGFFPAARGAVTPVWLATMPIVADRRSKSGRHFYQEQEIAW